jgi:hypothetical protein
MITRENVEDLAMTNLIKTACFGLFAALNGWGIRYSNF